MLIDTHCHIHEADYPLAAGEVLERARQAGVGKMICVGTNEKSSEEAIQFAAAHDNVFAAIGVHPHDTKEGWERIHGLTQLEVSGINPPYHTSLRHNESNAMSLLPAALAMLRQSSASQDMSLLSSGDLRNDPGELIPGTSAHLGSVSVLAVSGSEVGGMAERSDREKSSSKLVAIGEIGLDYFYAHSSRETQIKALEEQIQVALDHDLPIIFHVREAFDDFWPVFDNFRGIRGELHSFTDTQANLDEGLKRGLYVGVNGISTFTKDEAQKRLFAQIPLERMLLETDAPFLTPTPKRGTVNEPAFVSYVARHHATIRGISPEEIASATSANASTLFAI